MNLDLRTRSSLAFIFGFVGLMVMTIGSLIGLPVSTPLIGGFVSIIVTTLGVEVVRVRRDGDNGREPPVVEEKTSSGKPSASSAPGEGQD